MRNIGIIAHVDAGKTTFTERVLYYSGRKYKIGEVHEGDTVTDYLEQERERGITIVSAAVQFTWHDHVINLIDTPGHIDFNIEVERSLCVLEGAVVIIDGSTGVEPQTECVWNQANKYHISRIVFVNKMDKEGANFEEAVASLNKKLSVSCIAIQSPVYDANGQFLGVFDLLNKQKYLWLNRNHEYNVYQFSELSAEEQKTLEKKREAMIEAMAYFDDELLSLYLDGRVDDSKLNEYVIKLTRSMKIYPVLLGSAFHNKGVQLVLNAINELLPNIDNLKVEAYDIEAGQNIQLDHKGKIFVGFCFKLVHDNYSGVICYTRVYSGSIKSGEYVYNSNSKRKIRVKNIIRFYANEKESLQECSSGDIVGLVLDNTVTGDTICDLSMKVKLVKIDVPDSVIDLAVQPATKQDQDKFAKYIGMYLLEDPTIKIRFDEEQRETILSGVGSLQLEILISRLKTERGINLKVSKPQVSYREAITKQVTYSHLHKKQTGGAGQYAGVMLTMERCDDDFIFVNKITKGSIPRQYIPEIEKACKDTMMKGPISGSRVVGVKISLLDGDYHPVDSSSLAYYIATRDCLHHMLQQAEPILLEPIFKLVVYTTEDYMNIVIGDIYQKSGVIDSVNRDESKVGGRIIHAYMSLEHLFTYADDLRGITRGMATCVYSFYEYRKCLKNINE